MKVDLHQLDTRFASLRAQQPQRERRLVADLAEHGQRQGLVVVQEVPDRFVVIDGHKRVRAAKRLGWAQVEVLTWDLSPQDALVYERLQRSEESDSALEQGWLLRELIDTYGMALDTLAVRFGKSKSWVSRRLALVEVLPAQVMHAVAAGALSAYVAEKYFVPLARANAGEAERVAHAVAGKALSTRDIGEVVAAYQRADAQGRDRLVADPNLYLQALAASRTPEPKPTGSPVEMLRVLLARLTTNLGRCQQMLVEQATSLDVDQRRQLHELIVGVTQATEFLVTVASMEIGYARPEHSDRYSQVA